MAYCHRCGGWADLDHAAMCAACRRDWRPAGDRPGDLGCHAQQHGPGEAAVSRPVAGGVSHPL